MYFIEKLALFVALFLLTASNFSVAGTEDAERAALARIIHEVNLIEQMVTDAERNKSNISQYTFQYLSLKSDLKAIVEGIQAHLSRPSRMPKPVAPLIKDYSE